MGLVNIINSSFPKRQIFCENESWCNIKSSKGASVWRPTVTSEVKRVLLLDCLGLITSQLQGARRATHWAHWTHRSSSKHKGGEGPGFSTLPRGQAAVVTISFVLGNIIFPERSLRTACSDLHLATELGISLSLPVLKLAMKIPSANTAVALWAAWRIHVFGMQATPSHLAVL